MQSLSPQDAYALIEKEDAILIDVREEAEYEECHIEGSQLAPLSVLPESIQALNLGAQSQKIIVYCLKGGRSAQAIEFLCENIFKGRDVYNMSGGILEWIAQDLPVEK